MDKQLKRDMEESIDTLRRLHDSLEEKAQNIIYDLEQADSAICSMEDHLREYRDASNDEERKDAETDFDYERDSAEESLDNVGRYL